MCMEGADRTIEDQALLQQMSAHTDREEIEVVVERGRRETGRPLLMTGKILDPRHIHLVILAGMEVVQQERRTPASGVVPIGDVIDLLLGGRTKIDKHWLS